MSEIFEEVLGPTAKLETSPPFLLISANSSHPQRVPIPGTPTLWNRSHCPPPCWTCWLPVHAVLCGANPTHPFWAPQWLSSFLLRGRFQPLLISCVVFHSSHWWKARNLRGRSKTTPEVIQSIKTMWYPRSLLQAFSGGELSFQWPSTLFIIF